MIAGQKTIIDTLLTAVKKTDEIEKKYQEQLKLKDDEIELVKPKWWQNSFVIIGEIVLAFITGVLIAK